VWRRRIVALWRAAREEEEEEAVVA
jgi:hypothetical protein